MYDIQEIITRVRMGESVELCKSDALTVKAVAKSQGYTFSVGVYENRYFVSDIDPCMPNGMLKPNRH